MRSVRGVELAYGRLRMRINGSLRNAQNLGYLAS